MPRCARSITSVCLSLSRRITPSVCGLCFSSPDERRLHNWVTALGRGNAEERIATLLLDLRGRLFQAGLANGSEIQMPLTQQEIGDHLGLTLVHVNRVLRRLRENGIVTVQRGIITVDDITRLAKIAAPMQDIYERETPEFGGRSSPHEEAPLTLL